MWPVGSLRRRASLGGIGRPVPQVPEDPPHHARIVDQGDDAHRPLAPGACERIGFVDLADQCA